MKLSEIELDFLYEKSAELFRDKVKQRGEDYEHDNRCACQNGVRRTHLRTLARESIEDVKILIEELRNNGYEALEISAIGKSTARPLRTMNL